MKNFLLLISFLSTILYSQTEVSPRLSPRSSIMSTVGFTEIRIDYSSPGVKGRKVFGDLEGYGSIWRAGANEATKISFSTDVKINGHFVPQGSYSFFVIPEVTNEWVLIFNKESNQWGKRDYDESKDFLRIVIDPDFTQESRERLIYDIQSNGVDKASVQLYWSLLKLSFEINVNFIDKIENRLSKAVKEQKTGEEWKPYYDLASFFSKQSYDHPKSEFWIDKVIDDLISLNNSENKNNLDKAYWVKAKILAKHDKKAEARVIFENIISGDRSKYIQRNIGKMQNIAASWGVENTENN